MFVVIKNPFTNQSDGEISVGLVVATLIYIAWMAMTFWDANSNAVWFWAIRGVISLFILYSWIAGLVEIRRRRKQKRDQ